MLASVVFIAALLCAVGFMAWLAFFILNRGFNTFLETDRESRRQSRNYLLFGGLLFVGAIAFGYWFTVLEPPVPPELQADYVPPADAVVVEQPSMERTLVAGGIVVCGLLFFVWLGTFALNRSFNMSLRTERDVRRSAYGQLVIGAVLLGLTAFMVVYFFQLGRPGVVVNAQTSAVEVDAAPADAIAPQTVE